MFLLYTSFCRRCRKTCFICFRLEMHECDPRIDKKYDEHKGDSRFIFTPPREVYLRLNRISTEIEVNLQLVGDNHDRDVALGIKRWYTRRFRRTVALYARRRRFHSAVEKILERCGVGGIFSLRVFRFLLVRIVDDPVNRGSLSFSSSFLSNVSYVSLLGAAQIAFMRELRATLFCLLHFRIPLW